MPEALIQVLPVVVRDARSAHDRHEARPHGGQALGPGGGEGIAMRRCAAIKGTGERCKSGAMKGSSWCYGHSPEKADQRRQNASRGGTIGGRGRGGGRGGAELQALKGAIQAVTDAVLTGELKTGPASIALQGYNTALRALEIERRTFDAAELLERLELLEARADRIRGA